MIIKENLVINGRDFVKTYSDLGVMIERNNCLYSEAIDLEELNRTYIETNERIDGYTPIEEKAMAYDILMEGV